MSDVPPFDVNVVGRVVPRRALAYLAHSLRPGDVSPQRVHLTLRGSARPRPEAAWGDFQAVEDLTTARTLHVRSRSRMGPLPVVGEEFLAQGAGVAVSRLLNVISLSRDSSPDVARAAKSRWLADAIWLPSIFLPVNGAAWTEGQDGVHVSLSVERQSLEARLDIGPAGEIRQMTLPRWSQLTPDGTFGRVAYRIEVEAENTFGGCTIPSQVRAFWCSGTEREFECLRATVESATYGATV